MLVAWGYTNQQIAGRLAVSAKTIEAHKYSGMRKLGFADRAALVKHAVVARWLVPERLPPAMTETRAGPDASHDRSVEPTEPPR
jgi:hypothetical protein